VATVIRPGPIPAVVEAAPRSEARHAVRDSLIVTLAGQVERAIGTLTAFALRWGLDPSRLGVYTGLRLYLDNTNRSSLGVGLGAVQQIPILRASGNEAEARRVADIAHTTNTITCLVYAVALLAWAWIRRPLLTGDPLAAEWTWGLVAMAGLTILKRYESFLIAVLRARQEFVVTSQVDVVESLVSIVAVSLGLWLAGFWGLLAAVGVIVGAKIAFLHARNPYRFGWAWETPTAGRLMAVGLPILANTAALGAVMNLDRVLILWRIPEGEKAVGLYSIALMGTSWSLDLAGRIVTVLYTYFQTTLGRTRDPVEVARQALRATEGQAPLLAAGSGVAFFAGPVFLGAVLPKYAEGLPALRPLLPGMLLLGLAWPARQMLITIDRPYRLVLATLIGLAVTTLAGLIGADRAGIVGVAWGMTVGYTALFLLTGATAFVPFLGLRAWCLHLLRLAAMLGWVALGGGLASMISPEIGRWGDAVVRLGVLAAWTLPALWVWGVRQGWGGLLPGRRGAT
jgi:O-antigen/teichoic acid export membrane protein